jgi:uncharacterized protein YbaR (Trm112 family)
LKGLQTLDSEDFERQILELLRLQEHEEAKRILMLGLLTFPTDTRLYKIAEGIPHKIYSKEFYGSSIPEKF